jgi:hypothetical protein
VKILIIGGPRNGEWVDELPDGVRGWVDIRSADTHVVRRITWTITDMDGKVIDAYVLHLAVHPLMTGPNEQTVAGQMLNMLAMAEFARAHGDRQEIPEEPAAADRAPNSPAGLFGPDGGAL